jgi:hypothetical protein
MASAGKWMWAAREAAFAKEDAGLLTPISQVAIAVANAACAIGGVEQAG